MKEMNQKLQDKSDADRKELLERLAEKDISEKEMMAEQARLRTEME